MLPLLIGTGPVPLSGDGRNATETVLLQLTRACYRDCPTISRRACFNAATPVKLAADETLFTAGDAGDGCYRINEGLLKWTMVSRAGGERILAFPGRGRYRRRTRDHRRLSAFGIGCRRPRRAVEFSQPGRPSRSSPRPIRRFTNRWSRCLPRGCAKPTR